MKKLIEDFLREAKQKFDYVDVLYEKVEKTEIKETGGKKTIVPLSVKSAVQVRFVKKKKIFSIKTSPEGLKNALEKAESIVKIIPSRNYALSSVSEGKTRYVIVPDISFVDEKIEDIVTTIFRGIEKERKNAEEKHGVKITNEVWFYSENHEKIVADTHGLYRTQKIPRTFLQVITRAVKDRERAMTRLRIGNIKGLELLFEKGKNLRLKKEIKEEIRKWMEYTVALLNAETMSPEEIKRIEYFVLDFNAIGVFVHEALGHNFEADIIKNGSSGIVDASGMPRGKIASEVVNIIDGPPVDEDGKPVYTDGFGTEMIDDEGVEVKVKLLAERGEVKDFILNRETADFFKREPNGGGFSELGDERVCRMSNTYIYPADKEVWKKRLEDIIKDIRYGVILKGTLGGAVSKEGMSSSIQMGYLIEDGKITKMIKPSNFTAKTLHALKYVDAFAGPLDISDVGFCGKAGQTKPVGDGGPKWTRIKNNPYVQLVVQG